MEKIIQFGTYLTKRRGQSEERPSLGEHSTGHKFPINGFLFDFGDRKIQVAYPGSYDKALSQLISIGRVDKKDLDDIVEIVEMDLRYE